MRHRRLAAGMIAGALLFGPSTPARAAPDSVKLALNIWVGFGPLYLAREKGFFQKRGVDVDLIVMEYVTAKYAALAAGKIDMAAGGADTPVLYLSEPDQFQYVTGLDDSNGGDGIVATKEITSLAGLRGKIVAVARGTVSEFYLVTLLKQAGLKESDLMIVDMNSDDAGQAFMDKRVDAAVTWEPHLSRAKASDFGHLLIDSSATPGLLADVLVARKEFIAKHSDQVKAVVDAWDDAVAYLAANRREGSDVMAKAMSKHQDLTLFAQALDGVRYYSANDNKVFFGTATRPGTLYETVKLAIAVWSELGKLKVKVTPEDVMNYSFVGD